MESDLMPSSPARSEESHTSGGEEVYGPVRGRGRGRRSRGTRPYPRRGGRGRGRGRGATVSITEDRASLVSERIENIRRVVGGMTEEEKTSVLMDVIEKQPSIMLDILEKNKNQQPPGGHHPHPDSPTPEWCTCGRCRQMPTEAENVCCGQRHPSCISLLPDFRFLVLDDSVLALAIMYRNDQLALAVDQDVNRSYRHAAYRQYILWSFGRLGAGNRRVIPSCSVWRIRDKFPDSFGQYTGFKSSRIA